jgi:Glyoxalase superfamily protein
MSLKSDLFAVFVQPETGSTMKAKLEAVQPVLMVRDVAASIGFFQILGFELAFCYSSADPKYAGVRRAGVELHLQWHDAKDFGLGDRPTYRFVVSEVDALSAEFSSRNADLDRTDVRDTPWGTREFHVRDPDLNGLQFYRDL